MERLRFGPKRGQTTVGLAPVGRSIDDSHPTFKRLWGDTAAVVLWHPSEAAPGRRRRRRRPASGGGVHSIGGGVVHSIEIECTQRYGQQQRSS